MVFQDIIVHGKVGRFCRWLTSDFHIPLPSISIKSMLYSTQRLENWVFGINAMKFETNKHTYSDDTNIKHPATLTSWLDWLIDLLDCLWTFEARVWTSWENKGGQTVWALLVKRLITISMENRFKIFWPLPPMVEESQPQRPSKSHQPTSPRTRQALPALRLRLLSKLQKASQMAKQKLPGACELDPSCLILSVSWFLGKSTKTNPLHFYGFPEPPTGQMLLL